MSTPALTIIGSVNLDLVASAEKLPVAGETVTGATFAQHPGGKGANQALAARRLGAEVSMIARTGEGPNRDAALALLRQDGVDLSGGCDGIAIAGIPVLEGSAMDGYCGSWWHGSRPRGERETSRALRTSSRTHRGP